MTSTQKFEGPELAALLDQVHATLGADARVIAANRCRVGGIGGFFARETFEVIVELPDAAPAPAATMAPAAAAMGDEAATAAPSAPRSAVPVSPRGSRSVARKRAAARGAAPANRSSATTPHASAATSAQPTSATAASNGSHLDALEELIAAADRADAMGAATPVPAVAASGGPAARVNASAEPSAPMGFDALFAQAAAQESQQMASAPTGSAETGGRRSRRVAKAERAERKAAAARAKAERSGRGRRRADDAPPAWAVAATTAPQTFERVIDLAGIERAGLALPLAPGAIAPGTLLSARSTQLPAGASAGLGAVPVEALAALGLPETWLRGAIGGHMHLTNVLGHLVAPPPIISARGSVLAFVGESDLILNVARAVAAGLKQDPNECVLLSPSPRANSVPCEHITTIDELVYRREMWATLDRVTIVAIDAGFSRQDVAWGRHAISILHPAMRWGVVSATRKVEDIRSWARGIGGLHALAVHGIAETATPASILDSGVPVARVDGQVATPELWLKILEDRLVDATTRRVPDLIAS